MQNYHNIKMYNQHNNSSSKTSNLKQSTSMSSLHSPISSLRNKNQGIYRSGGGGGGVSGGDRGIIDDDSNFNILFTPKRLIHSQIKKSSNHKLCNRSFWNYRSNCTSPSSIASNTSIPTTADDDYVLTNFYPNYQHMMNDNLLIDRCTEAQLEMNNSVRTSINEPTILKSFFPQLPSVNVSETELSIPYNEQAAYNPGKLSDWIIFMGRYLDAISITNYDVKKMTQTIRKIRLQEHYELRKYIASYNGVIKCLVKNSNNEMMEKNKTIEESYLKLLLRAIDLQCLLEGYPGQSDETLISSSSPSSSPPLSPCNNNESHGNNSDADSSNFPLQIFDDGGGQHQPDHFNDTINCFNDTFYKLCDVDNENCNDTTATTTTSAATTSSMSNEFDQSLFTDPDNKSYKFSNSEKSLDLLIDEEFSQMLRECSRNNDQNNSANDKFWSDMNLKDELLNAEKVKLDESIWQLIDKADQMVANGLLIKNQDNKRKVNNWLSSSTRTPPPPTAASIMEKQTNFNHKSFASSIDLANIDELLNFGEDYTTMLNVTSGDDDDNDGDDGSIITSNSEFIDNSSSGEINSISHNGKDQVDTTNCIKLDDSFLLFESKKSLPISSFKNIDNLFDISNSQRQNPKLKRQTTKTTPKVKVIVQHQQQNNIQKSRQSIDSLLEPTDETCSNCNSSCRNLNVKKLMDNAVDPNLMCRSSESGVYSGICIYSPENPESDINSMKTNNETSCTNSSNIKNPTNDIKLKLFNNKMKKKLFIGKKYTKNINKKIRNKRFYINKFNKNRKQIINRNKISISDDDDDQPCSTTTDTEEISITTTSPTTTTDVESEELLNEPTDITLSQLGIQNLELLECPIQNLRKEDFETILNLCRSNINCLNSVLTGNNKIDPQYCRQINNFSATISNSSTESSKCINECQCGVIACFVQKLVNYVFDLTNIVRNCLLYRFYMKILREVYCMIKTVSSQIGQQRRLLATTSHVT